MCKIRRFSLFLGILITLLLVGGMSVLSARDGAAAASAESGSPGASDSQDTDQEFGYTSPLLERLLDWSVLEEAPAEGHLLSVLPGHSLAEKESFPEDEERSEVTGEDPKDETEAGPGTEEDLTEQISYTCTEDSRSVYATRGMYVRSGPSMDYPVVGYYGTGAAISVTGRCSETGWWRITYYGETAFVSDKITSLTPVGTASRAEDSTPSSSSSSPSSSSSSSAGTSGQTGDAAGEPEDSSQAEKAPAESTGSASYNGICVGDTISGKATFYCACAKCTGTGNGVTASGKKVYNGMSLSTGIVACNWLPLGSRISVNGTEYEVADRGGSGLSTVGRIDIFVPEGHNAALAKGKQSVTITILSLP